MTFKKKLISVICYGLFSTALQAEVTSWTLQDCLILAEKNHVPLKGLRKEELQLAYEIKARTSAYYPSISASASLTKSGSEKETNLDNMGIVLSLNQLLYDFGARPLEIQENQIQLDIKKEEIQQQIQDLYLQTKEAFYMVQKSQEKMALNRHILDRRKESMTLIKLKYQGGLENSASFSQAESDVLESEFNQKSNIEDNRLAKEKLGLLLDLDLSEIAFQKSNELYTDLSLKSIKDLALVSRPDLKKERLKKEVLRIQYMKVKKEFFPTLGFTASQGLNATLSGNNQQNWKASVTLHLPLFDGFSTTFKLKQAKIALDIQDEKINQLKKQIQMEVNQAYYAYVLSQERKKLSQKSLIAIQTLFKLTSLSYKQGRTSYFTLQNYEYNLSKAEYTMIDSHYQYLMAMAQLLKAIGKNEIL